MEVNGVSVNDGWGLLVVFLINIDRIGDVSHLNPEFLKGANAKASLIFFFFYIKMNMAVKASWFLFCYVSRLALPSLPRFVSLQFLWFPFLL